VLGEKLGVECGVPRLPIPPLSDDEASEVLAGAKEFGLLKRANL